MNRAVHGDVVVVQVFPEAEWSAPADEVVDQDSESDISRKCRLFLNEISSVTLKDDDAESSGDERDEDELDEVLSREKKLLLKEQRAKQKKAHGRQPTGRVVGIIKRNWRA